MRALLVLLAGLTPSSADDVTVGSASTVHASDDTDFFGAALALVSDGVLAVGAPRAANGGYERGEVRLLDLETLALRGNINASCVNVDGARPPADAGGAVRRALPPTVGRHLRD